MGLFEKKVEKTFVFVGEFTDSIGANGVAGLQLGLEKKAFINFYRPRLEELLGGEEPEKVFWFDDWSARKYRLTTLLNVKQKGFELMDMGEGGTLLKEITGALGANYGVGLRNLFPSLIIEQGRWAGIFAVVCKVAVKPSRL